VRLLLDTHAFLWFLAGDRRMRPSARRRIEDARNERLLSVASIWELAIKTSLGKLELDDPLDELIERGVEENDVRLLSISKTHALRVAALPWHHRDPFDRLLVAQALEDDLALLSAETAFDAYGARRVW
jgi:PIN domain nuclease of toxin-antitoxin system